MKRFLLASACVFSFASSALACPAGQPAAPWPGLGFVPTTNCQGWVPTNHPLAMHAPEPLPPSVPPSGLVPALAGQAIYAALELPATVRVATGGLQALQGYAVDCALGSFPPSFEIRETKPDGSTRQVPNDFFWSVGLSRPDIQGAIGAACPAVYAAPSTDGSSLGPTDAFGWTLRLRTPITELGVHTFTIISAWPAQGHAGSSSITVQIVP